MRKLLMGAAALASLAALGAAAAPMDGMRGPDAQQMMEDHAAMLDAGLAGLKAALKLTPDQEKNWAPFEAAARDAHKAREDAMKAMHDGMNAGEKPSPVDRLDAMATNMEQGAKSMHALAAAAKPLYASLDPTQQRRFDFLARMLMEHGPHGMGGHEGMMAHGFGGPGGEPPAPNAQ